MKKFSFCNIHFLKSLTVPKITLKFYFNRNMYKFEWVDPSDQFEFRRNLKFYGHCDQIEQDENL